MRTFIAKNSSSLQVQDRLSKGADFLESQIHDNFGSFLTGDNAPRIRRIIQDADKYVSVHSRLSAVLHKIRKELRKGGTFRKYIEND